MPPANTPQSVDLRIQALEKVVSDGIKAGSVDPARVYLAGRGEAAAAVFYAVSRVPDLWAAEVAIGGSARPAVDSNRLYAANFMNAPILWIGNDSEDETLATKLKAAGVNLEYRPAAGVTPGVLFQWLARHQRQPFPESIDCETNSPTFASCYWIRMVKFDPGERNDVLPSSRVQPGSGAALDLGGFGFKLDDPGPGVRVSWLPDKYKGPLKLDDRIVELDGRKIENARQYAAIMEKTFEERPVVAMVQRGKDKVRLETRIVVPQRESTVTARVQAAYNPQEKTIQIISRTVTEMRVTIPPLWTPATLNWNGTPIEKVETGGCRLLTEQTELLHAENCP